MKKPTLSFLLSPFSFLLSSFSFLFPSVAHALSTEEVNIGSEVKGFFGFTCIQSFVYRIVDIGILVSGLLLLVYLVYGGVEWLTSGGDKGKVENAKSRITNAVIGVAIIAASFAIWRVALTFFGIDLANICTDNPINGGSSPSVPSQRYPTVQPI